MTLTVRRLKETPDQSSASVLVAYTVSATRY